MNTDSDAAKFVFLGGSQYSLKVLLSIVQCRCSELAYFVFDSLLTECVEWESLSSVVPDINSRLVSAAAIRDSSFIDSVRCNQLQLALSVNFMHRIGSQFLRAFPFGCINLHPSLLPYNRGTWPELWSIIEGTPGGVSLHYMDEGLDSGPVIDQTEVYVHSFDTGATLCTRIEDAGIALVRRNWAALCNGHASSFEQTFKTPIRSDNERLRLEQLDLLHVATLREHLNTLRALTLEPFIRGGWYIDRDTGERIRVTVKFEIEDPA